MGLRLPVPDFEASLLPFRSVFSIENNERIKRPLAGCCQQLSCIQVIALYGVVIYNCNMYILDRPGYPEVRH